MARNLVLAAVLFAQMLGASRGHSSADFLVRETVPSSGLITLEYDSFYHGLRFDFTKRAWMVGDIDVGTRGGCSFEDLTDTYSPVRVVADEPNKLVIRATPRHRVQYRCNWIVPYEMPQAGG